MNIKSIIIVGAGQLGQRHLQSLAAFASVETLYVIEPSSDARLQAKERFMQVSGHETKQLHFTDFTELKLNSVKIDAAIIATLSCDRVAVLSDVLSLGIHYILCEKVLFQSVADYQEALRLTNEKKAHVYVNHILRYTPQFMEIKHHISTKIQPVTMCVEAGDAGFGCNVIHTLDIFEYLTGHHLLELQAEINRPFLHNKRGAGFIEFTGNAQGKTGEGDIIEVRYAGNLSTLPVIKITVGDDHFIVDQQAGTYTKNGNISPFAMPMVSALTSQIMLDIVAGTCVLPTIKQNFNVNCLMLNAFNRSLQGSFDDNTRCSIT